MAGIDYALDGSVRSVYLRDGVFVHLCPELSRQAGEFLHKGAKMTAIGDAQTFAGQTTLEAKSVTIAGRTFIAQPLLAGAQLAGSAPPPPMPGLRAPRPELERGSGGPGPIAPPPPRGPQTGGPGMPPPAPQPDAVRLNGGPIPPPPPPDAARSKGGANDRPGVPQPGGMVPPPPPSQAIEAAPQPGAIPTPLPAPVATTPQP